MPRFDGTGPMGQGPMTGRCLGSCSGYRGMNRGFCRNIPTKTEEKELTEEYIKDLENELKAAKEYMQDLQK